MAQVLRFGYLQQVVSLGAVFGFNLLVPAITGLDDFGRFTTAHGLLMLVIGLTGGGLDLILTRDIRSPEGHIHQTLFWRALVLRLALSSATILLALSPWSPLHDVPIRSGIGAATLVACALAIATSSHCISVVIGALAARQAALLSMLHSVPYFALPLLLWGYDGHGPASLMKGVLWSYIGMVAAEVWVLRGMSWSASGPAPRLGLILRSALLVSPNSLFESARTWGSVLLASYWLTPSDLGVARTAFSIAAALVSLTPVPMQAMVALGHRLEQAYKGSMRLADLLRHVSVLAALSAALAVICYGMLMPPSAASSYAGCAAGALLLTGTGPMTRLAISLNVANSSGRHTGLVLVCAMLAVLASAAGSLLIGPMGLLMGAALASMPVAGAMPAALRRRIAPADATTFVIGSALTLALVAAMMAPLWMLAALVITLMIGYGIWKRRDLLALSAREDQGP